jgi:sec-independent protein translocase protein TatC
MLDPADAIGKARAAMTERAELPGMSLMEHLDELRRRIVHSAIYLGLGFFICWFFRDRIVGFLQAPLNHIGKSLVFTHPMDALNLDLQAALLA